jgi:hypothetical protein
MDRTRGVICVNARHHVQQILAIQTRRVAQGRNRCKRGRMSSRNPRHKNRTLFQASLGFRLELEEVEVPSSFLMILSPADPSARISGPRSMPLSPMDTVVLSA